MTSNPTTMKRASRAAFRRRATHLHLCVANCALADMSCSASLYRVLATSLAGFGWLNPKLDAFFATFKTYERTIGVNLYSQLKQDTVYSEVRKYPDSITRAPVPPTPIK